MPKKQEIYAVLHFGDDPEKGREALEDRLADWYVELVRRRLLDSGLTAQEQCTVLDLLSREWKNEEKGAAAP